MTSQGFCRLYAVLGCLDRIINQIAFYISVDPVKSINYLYNNLVSDVLLVVISEFKQVSLPLIVWVVLAGLQS